jgi:hypothetical protein
MAVALYFYTSNTNASIGKYLDVTDRSVNGWCHDFDGFDGPIEAQPAWVQLAKKFITFVESNIKELQCGVVPR